jgi:tripartite-type tricarboxylate transporter receptor subunit TctC
MINAASTAAMIKAGSLRPLAVLAEKRLADYPDIPTLAEAGYPGVGTSMAEHAGARRHAEGGARDACSRRSRAAKAPQLQEAYASILSVIPHDLARGRRADLA